MSGSAFTVSAIPLMKRMISLAIAYPGAALPPKITVRGTMPAA